jgi:hypothetical protein
LNPETIEKSPEIKRGWGKNKTWGGNKMKNKMKNMYLFYLPERLLQNFRLLCGKFLWQYCYSQKSPIGVEKHEILLKKKTEFSVI